MKIISFFAVPLSTFIFTSNNTRESNRSGTTFEFEENLPYHVGCTAKGGNPMPTLRISLGKKDISDQFIKIIEDKVTGLPGLTMSNYKVQLLNNSFVALKEHRGETLKCVAKFHRYTDLRQAKPVTLEVKCKCSPLSS